MTVEQKRIDSILPRSIEQKQLAFCNDITYQTKRQVIQGNKVTRWA